MGRSAQRALELLRRDACVLASALDVHTLADRQIGPNRLRHLHEHAAAQSDDDLLARDRLIVLLLNFVADHRAADGANHHNEVAAGAGTDQAADAESAQAADDGTEALMLLGRNLRAAD